MNPRYRFKYNHGHIQQDQKDHEIIKIAGKSRGFRWRFQYLKDSFFQRGGRADDYTSGIMKKFLINLGNLSL